MRAFLKYDFNGCPDTNVENVVLALQYNALKLKTGKLLYDITLRKTAMKAMTKTILKEWRGIRLMGNANVLMLRENEVLKGCGLKMQYPHED